jgi:hypothetical protein
MRRPISIAISAVLAVLLACSSGSGPAQDAQYPYAGPSCDPATNTWYGTACWNCALNNCGADCETTACDAYYRCYCACDPNGPPVEAGLGYEDACQSACNAKITPSCATCLDSVGTCQNQKCEPACGYVDAAARVRR